MSHYAKIENGLVTQVIVADADFVTTQPGQWVQTSYNTRNNTHTLGGTPLRGNYAGVGHIYDAVNDVFYPPAPYASWQLNTDTWSWQAPVACPQDGKMYFWDESAAAWQQLII
jgi:hypothetical protein